MHRLIAGQLTLRRNHELASKTIYRRYMEFIIMHIVWSQTEIIATESILWMGPVRENPPARRARVDGHNKRANGTCDSREAGNSQPLFGVFQKWSICVRVFGHVPEGIRSGCAGRAGRRFVEFSSRQGFPGTVVCAIMTITRTAGKLCYDISNRRMISISRLRVTVTYNGFFSFLTKSINRGRDEKKLIPSNHPHNILVILNTAIIINSVIPTA